MAERFDPNDRVTRDDHTRDGTVKLTDTSKMIGTNARSLIQQAHVTCCHISNDRPLSIR